MNPPIRYHVKGVIGMQRAITILKDRIDLQQAKEFADHHRRTHPQYDEVYVVDDGGNVLHSSYSHIGEIDYE